MKTTKEHKPLIPRTNAGANSPAAALRRVFLERKERNAAYSTRAFARDLGMSQALLSMVMSGKRPLTVKQAAQISVLLDHSREEARQFLELTLVSLPENSKGLKKLRQVRAQAKTRPAFTNYDVERFKVISQWYHVAILDLTSTVGFRADSHWIAKRLGISSVEARDAVERMLELGMLTREGSTLRKPDGNVYFTTQRSEPAVRAFHKQMMAKAQAKLDETGDSDYAEREISSITLAIRKDRMVEARARIQSFQKELAEFLTEGDCDEVFQLNVQLFPLTQKLNTGE